MEKIESDFSHEQIAPYNPKWIDLYETEATKLKEIFGDKLLGIEHIGSTSIPGLPAKPIIDLMILIDSHKNASKFIPPLQGLDYPFDSTSHTDQSTERHFFRKGNPTKFHLSVAYADRGGFWKRQLAFRDYLREHPDQRDRYAELKQKLIKEDPTGKSGYIGGKTELINEILDKAGFEKRKSTE
ncbi:MAG: hypothetical protein COU09_01160 [Candidatus Harrisonbacteria bacterium CG10_big_fil_rev_8_21_14_0_10_44_23]|uniref:GrpB family protein n=1 Tax=Candidatus Harrisonbacteria bacterium CG10_big_fil_rev_8_21_14_0_10_44_23 TaxID=1974585 RepID=A0A2H0UQH0_9BACT|nr:MAG: hypothetical protein COU09_01160 [Candidatus Harrisonbacteria bacterium CG10_big_fil_rev_8_21_14_0_10_44_23]